MALILMQVECREGLIGVAWQEFRKKFRGRNGLGAAGGSGGAAVESGVGDAHFGGCFEGCSNLDQRPLADAGAEARGLAPCAAGGDEFGPEGEEAALGRLGGMDGAAVFEKEGALAVAGFAESEQMAGAVDVAAFELRGVQSQEARGAAQIVFRQIDEALLVAAAGAAGLAGEAEGFHEFILAGKRKNAGRNLSQNRKKRGIGEDGLSAREPSG